MTINELAAAALEAVTARGYREGVTDDQFVARNLCKATEELGEAVGGMVARGPVDDWIGAAYGAGDVARAVFDAWGDGVDALSPDNVRLELPDILIPLLCAAAVLGVDLEAAVLAKAGADVARGVR